MLNDIKELDSFEDNLNIRIHFIYPDYNDLLQFQPKERIKIIRQRQRDLYKGFINTIGKKAYKRIGSKYSPSGLEINCTKKDILKFSKDKRVKYIFIQSEKDDEIETIELFYAVKARFVIQIENRTKGFQDYEDRILLIKGKSGEDAEQRLLKGFKDYEKPYLNSKGELVRWKFEEFIDWYETNYNSIEDMLKDNKDGIEIFSRLKTRKLNKDRIWIRENKK